MVETPSYVRGDLLEDSTLLRLRIDRPAGNVLTIGMIRDLEWNVRQAGSSSGVRLIVIRGAGGNFSYGASIHEHRAREVPELLAAFHQLVRTLVASPVPTAALVEGICFGGGFELALCCQFIFARPDARFSCPEIKLGVFPPVLAAIGALRIGGPAAEKLLLTGIEMDADQAREAGLLAEIFPATCDPEVELLNWYRRHLRPLSAFSLRQAVRAARAGLVEAVGEPLARLERQYLEALPASHDGNEGIEAFLAHRPPEWQDR